MTSTPPQHPAEPTPSTRLRQEDPLRYYMFIWIPVAIMLAGAGIGVLVMETYGLAVFVVTPLVASLNTGFLCERSGLGRRASAGASILNLVLSGIVMLLTGFEGVICLAMATPLAMPLAVLAALAGHALSARLRSTRTTTFTPVIVALIPLFMGAEEWAAWPLVEHTVVTTVEIDAPIRQVWNKVIAFDEIQTPPSGLLALGFAYPVRARIEGEGVGAVRYCEFSTGAFVEPITTWDDPHRLAFDVVENPPPMQEWSPYPNLDVPHLHDTFLSNRGQFVLREQNGKTILEGTTWYTQALWPDAYWSLWTNAIIHRIHLRVLHHIRERAEGEPPRLTRPATPPTADTGH